MSQTMSAAKALHQDLGMALRAHPALDPVLTVRQARWGPMPRAYLERLVREDELAEAETVALAARRRPCDLLKVVIRPVAVAALVRQSVLTTQTAPLA